MRLSGLITFALTCTALTALAAEKLHAASAENLSVRTGEHRGYSRLVFDWPAETTYEIKDESESSFTIAFNKAATINAAQKARNIKGINVISSNPLVLKVDVPGGAKSRSFAVRSRIVVDIYDPPPGAKAAEKKPEAKSDAKPEEKPEEKKPDAPKAAEAKPAETKPADKPKAEPKAAAASLEQQIKEKTGAAGAAVTVTEDKAAQPPDQGALKQATTPPSVAAVTNTKAAHNIVRPNLVTLSATQSIGLAVFETGDEIWMIADKEALPIKPQVSGANADALQPVRERDVAGGKIYIINNLDGTNLRGEGGTLLWKVMISPEKHDRKPVEPVRVDVNPDEPRSGKIIWPLKGATRVLDVVESGSGQTLKVVTVESADQLAGNGRSFVDFDVLTSAVGIAIRPKVSDLDVKVTKEGVEISRPSGLALLPQDKMVAVEKESFTERMSKASPNDRRIFNFEEWRMGGLEALNENRTVILASMGDMSEGSRIENLITLAKMQLANGRGAEALGFLSYAEQELPELAQNPEFLSLQGVAKAFDWKTDAAFDDLSSDVLKDYEEIQFWRAFALADLGDWQQADAVMPENLAPLEGYPAEIRNRLAIVLAEIALRAGKLPLADRLFAMVEKEADKLNLAHDSALKYLKGEAARQRGKVDETKTLWGELAKGSDDLYRVKAGLALARLQMEAKEITPKEAIDRLERLRYAWRGDELEAQVGYWLGRTYFENGEHVKGLKIMRDASVTVPESVLSRRIAADMGALFTDFYLKETLDKSSPLDAVSLYEEFTELVPPGPQGDMVIARLAEHLVNSDLMERGGNLLSAQIDHRLKGDAAAKTAVRLAAIRLLDGNAKAAEASLNKASQILSTLPPEQNTKARQEEIMLLKAKTLSEMDRTDEALKLLETLTPGKDVNRLRADIAWRAGYWDDAAYALEDIMLDEDISLTRPLSDEHAQLVLQRVVAQNLSGDRIGLANMREKYADAMAQTTRAKLFDVVTRPRQNAGLADRDTLLSAVSETDLFKGFLDSYRAAEKPPSQ